MKENPKGGKIIIKDRCIVCPVCGRKTQQRVMPDTKAESLPIWCKWCRQQSIVDI